MAIPTFDPRWTAMSPSASIYEWVRNYHGLMPLRESCSRLCWMSDAAWIEWKSYSRPRYNYVAWLPESTPFSVFRSTTLGTRSLSGSAVMQRETSSQVLKNALRLRTSKSLTSDALNARLTPIPGSAMRLLNRFDFGSGGSRMFGRTFSRSSGSASGNLLWSDERSDPIADMREWVQWARMEEES